MEQPLRANETHSNGLTNDVALVSHPLNFNQNKKGRKL
jgi:hypothetical protein